MSDAMIGWVFGGLAVFAAIITLVCMTVTAVRRRAARYETLCSAVRQACFLVSDLGHKLGYAAADCRFVPASEKYVGAVEPVLDAIQGEASVTSARVAAVESMLDDKASVSAMLTVVNALADRIHGIEEALGLAWVEIPEQAGYVQVEESEVSKKQKTKNQ